MQVAFTPATAAEVRLLATFMQDYADLLENAAPAATPEVKAEPPKRERKTKAAEPEQTKAAEPEQTKAAEPEQTKAAKIVTHDDLRARFSELDKQDKRKDAVAVVTGLGFSSIKDIPADKCAAVMEGWASL